MTFEVFFFIDGVVVSTFLPLSFFFQNKLLFFGGIFPRGKQEKKTRTRTTVNAGLAMEFRRDCANRRRTFSIFPLLLRTCHVFRAFSKKNIYVHSRSRSSVRIFFENFGDAWNFYLSKTYL